MSNHRDRGIVLLMVIAILVTITFAGTAFVVFMREASQAAANVSHLTQAELAARSGLEHAIRVIEESMELCVSSTGALGVTTATFYTDPAADEDGDGDPDGAKVGWYRYFQGTELISGEARCAHTADGKVRGRKFNLSYPLSPERKRGEYAVYVADLDGKLHANIAKWDGGLGNLTDLLDLIQKAATSADSDITSTQTDLLGAASAGSPFSSTSEIARRAGVTSVFQGKYGLEKHFTVYPVLGSSPGTGITYELLSSSPIDATTSLITLPSAQLTPDEAIGSLVLFKNSFKAFGVQDNGASTVTVCGNCTVVADGEEFTLESRPAINVNTAPEELLTEVFLAISTMRASGKPLSRALARYLCTLRALRPFANRHELEEAVRRATGDDALVDLEDTAYDPDNDLTSPTFLTEYQFNDVLNSIAPAYRGMSQLVANAQSAYDKPGEPGVYEFDGWPPFGAGSTAYGPSQTGGFRSSNRNVTWSTELKFTSRFFHIYVVGRGWVKGAGGGSPAGVRRLHAIYDAKPDSNPPGSSPGRIIWMRWNLSSRGSVSDIGP